MDSLKTELTLPYGWIALFWGSMFSGKTDEFVQLLNDAKDWGKLNVYGFKPKLDKRYETDVITSHNGSKFPAYNVKNVKEIEKILKEKDKVKFVNIIGVSETQFLDDKIIDFCMEQRKNGRKIVLEGLVFDYKSDPFNFKNSEKTMCNLLAHVDYPIHKIGFCSSCGNPSIYTKGKIRSKLAIPAALR